MDDNKLENEILRRFIWMNHGHSLSSLYGDDGCMQCHACLTEYGFYDWKNTPARVIVQKIEEKQLKRWCCLN